MLSEWLTRQWLPFFEGGRALEVGLGAAVGDTSSVGIVAIVVVVDASSTLPS